MVQVTSSTKQQRKVRRTIPTSSRSMAAMVLGSVSVLQAALAKPFPGMQIRLQTSGALSFPEVAAGPGKRYAAPEKCPGASNSSLCSLDFRNFVLYE